MKNHVCTLSKNDLKDLVKTYRVPLNLHPRLPDPEFTMNRLPVDAIDDLPSDGYDRNDVQRLCARLICLREMKEEMSIYDFMTLPSWSDAKIVEESHHLFLPLLERVPLHTTASVTEGAIIPLPTPDEIVASLPDSCLSKKSRGPSLVSRPSKKRKLQRRASEAGYGTLELDPPKGCFDLTPRLGKRLVAASSAAVVSASELTHARTLAPASTSGRSLSLGGAVVSGRVGKSRAEVMRRQMDSLDCLARSALARDAEYGQILYDDFGTATRGEEIDLTLFPLAPGPYRMPYPYEGVSSPLYTREEWDGPYAPESNILTESLLSLELSNRVNVLSALLVSHGYELNSRYTNLVSSRARLQEKFEQKKGDVKLLRSKVTSLDDKLEKLTDAKLSDQDLIVRDLQNELALEKSKFQGYNDVMDGLREEVTQFVGSGVEGVERGLCMGRINSEFEAAVQKISNFHVGAKADFDKALVDFPTTPFPFLSKIIAASRGTLFDMSKILLDKFVHSATSVAVAPSSANEALEQVSP
ncbi:hypothetical protein Tco_0270636 [Tanacetum coccineum]